ncbi:hypothetical protein J6590_061915 [Homalodisca vitripennis]|nr:hypothetical protein J6590_061915 [Homalodisca vitripennis]
MGKSCEQLLPPSEALPGIGEHCVVFHNGKGFYYTCREYSTSFEKRQFKCVRAECGVTATMGPEFDLLYKMMEVTLTLFNCVRAECGVTATMGPELGSPLQDDGSHTHPGDWFLVLMLLQFNCVRAECGVTATMGPELGSPLQDDGSHTHPGDWFLVLMLLQFNCVRAECGVTATMGPELGSPLQDDGSHTHPGDWFLVLMLLQFKCVRAECGVTATMGPDLGSPLQDDGSHTHPGDWFLVLMLLQFNCVRAECGVTATMGPELGSPLQDDGSHTHPGDWFLVLMLLQFKCVRAECGVTATMGPELGSPLQDDGSHTHPADWGYRDKCLLLQTIKERFLRDNSSASLILQEILSSLIFESEEDNEASCNFESITIEEQTPLNLFKVEPCLLDPIDENNELEEESDKLPTAFLTAFLVESLATMWELATSSPSCIANSIPSHLLRQRILLSAIQKPYPSDTAEVSLPPTLELNRTQPVNPQSDGKKAHPQHAKIKDINEDYETFFKKNIDFYRELINNYWPNNSSEYAKLTNLISTSHNTSTETSAVSDCSLSTPTPENGEFFLGHKQRNETNI